MSFKSIELKTEYRSLHDNIPRDFYIPLLSEAVSYKRSVGFFSSSILSHIALGIASLAKNGGYIQMVASPQLSSQDIEAIKKGYDERQKREIIQTALFRELKEPATLVERERLNLLASLIANGTMDIKIAVTKSGMYHEKLGLLEDREHNIVAFSGSPNETAFALEHNYETMDVYTSWADSENRIEKKVKAFNSIWNGTEENLTTIDFPELTAEIIKRYKKTEINYDDYEKQEDEWILCDSGNIETYETEKTPKNVPIMPKWLNLYDYQKTAIENWKKENFCGIFDMATGTGKTLTALASIVKLCQTTKANVCVIILCPYIHLVSQWIEDIEKFNIRPIIAFGSSPQKNWKGKLSDAVFKRNTYKDEKGFFCLVSTIASFCKEPIQKEIKRIKKPVLLIADEAHNLGASNYKKFLVPELYKYRLALSATLDRHFDESGTNALKDFFGEICISYGLQQAIKEKHLVPYKYYPVIVSLNEDEQDSYISLTKSISKEIILDSKTKKQKLSEKGKRLCIMRSRIIAGAKSKISSLLDTIAPYRNKNMILIYCGATKYQEDYYDDADTEDVRLIDQVIQELYNKYQMNITRFTATETNIKRQQIKNDFEDGTILQAIAAIKCLDEGVNIPSIKTAFILASSTNPKEYIQRRGRVLRLFKGKEFAEIYDFITLPYGLETASNKSSTENDSFKALAKNEVNRMKEFSSLSLNKCDSEPIIEKIIKSFNLDLKKATEEIGYEQ